VKGAVAGMPVLSEIEHQKLYKLLPSSVKDKIRFVADGPGPVLKDCHLCLAKSVDEDPVLGTGYYILWQHRDAIQNDSGGTVWAIQGNSCHYCSGVHRRRYKGWKLNMMREHLHMKPEKDANNQLFISRRDKDLVAYKEMGLHARLDASDGDCDGTYAREMHSTRGMKETFHLKGDLLWDRAGYKSFFKGVDPEAVGQQFESHGLPDGTVLSGYRTKDFRKSRFDPLPEGCVEISRDFEKAVHERQRVQRLHSDATQDDRDMFGRVNWVGRRLLGSMPSK